MKIKSLFCLFLIISFAWGESGFVWALAPRNSSFGRDLPFEAVQSLFSVSPAREALLKRVLPRKEVVIYDFETTSLDAAQAKPIEIAALKFRGTELVGKFYMLVDPEEPLEPIITEITGLTGRMLKGQTKVKEAVFQFLEFVGDAIPIGHNVDGLDKPMLEHLIQEFGFTHEPYKEGRKLHDTRKMARGLIPRSVIQRYNLDNLRRITAVPVEPLHSALSDTIVTALVYWRLKEWDNTSFVFLKQYLQEDPAALLKPLQIIFNYLQGQNYIERKYQALQYKPRSEMLVYMGNGKLEGFDAAARYFYNGGTRKILTLLNGQKWNHEKIKRHMSNRNLKQDNSQPTIHDRDLFVSNRNGRYDEKIQFVVKKAKEWGIESGNLILMGGPFGQRRRLMLIEKMKREGNFPRDLRVVNIPTRYLGTGHLYKKLEGKESLSTVRYVLNLAQNSVSEIETLFHFAREGHIAPFELPEEVREAYEMLRRTLTPHLETPAAFESAV